MPATRLIARQKLVSILADPANGFNARLAAIATEYGIHPFEIDWTPGSPTFFCASVAPEQIDSTGMLPADDGICVVLYTSVSQTNSNEERQKPSIFSGKLMLHVDFYLSRRVLNLLRHGKNLPADSAGDLEALPDAIEDAFLQTVMAKSVDWSPVDFNGDFSCSREPFLFSGDGWQQRLPFILMCEVHV
jgi:hypothetical protein